MIKSRKYNQGETSSFSYLKARCLSAAVPISTAVAIVAGLLLIAHKPARADAVETSRSSLSCFWEIRWPAAGSVNAWTSVSGTTRK